MICLKTCLREHRRLYRGSISPISHGDRPATICSLGHHPVLCLWRALSLSFSTIIFSLMREAKAHENGRIGACAPLQDEPHMRQWKCFLHYHAHPQGKSWPLRRHYKRLSDKAKIKVQHGAGLRPIHWFHSYKACSGGVPEF